MTYIEKIKNYNLPIVIFGASTTGEFTLKFCKQNEIKIDYFCDNNPDKIGKYFQGYKVKSLDELKVNTKDYLFLISVIDINDIINQLEKNGFKNWMSCNEALIDFYHPQASNTILSHDNYLNKDKFFIRGLDVVITERCSLKCRDCSNLMPYYENPKNYDTETLNKNIENLCSKIDKIGEVRIIGGEPFMNKEIHLIVKSLLINDKIDNVVIYTNATIMPTEEQFKILKNSKVSFYISNYGKLSGRYLELCNLLLKNNIPYIDAKIKWTDCSKINFNNRTDVENQNIFDNCCVKNLTTLLNNKLYRCPFFANADCLKAIPHFKEDCLDLSMNISKEEIKKYLLNKKFIKVCNYCNGRSFNDEEIESNIQIKNSISYTKYN
jgi:organic radical activating enzyme